MGNKKDAGKGKRRGKGRVPDFANLEPQAGKHVRGFSCIWRETPQIQSCIYPDFYTRGDRKVLIKMLSFLYLSLFRDEISSNNAVIYMQLFHCNNASIIRARALQLSLWKHRLTLCGAT